MPKQVSEEELEAVRRAVVRFPEGASIDEISDVIAPKIHRRTLQRRLAVLVERKQLLLEGGGRGSRYTVPAIRTDVNIEVGGVQLGVESGTPEVEIYIPISEASAEIKRLVCRPIQLRAPVGYNRDFIGTYQPNRTFYLTEEVREHLLEIGQSETGVLPAGTYALQIYNRLLIDLTWNSSRLEGNTYSLLETERLIERGDSADGKDGLKTQMILNHKAAIELLVQSAADTGFDRYTVCNLHALLSENLLPDPAACGRLRQHSVGIGASVFQPLQGGALINEFFDEVLFKANAITDPFEQAFFAMVQLPYLQAFDDVNKCVSRLAANIPLIRENLSPLSFVDVPENAYIAGLMGIYELNRTELLADVFIWAYERSCARYSAARQSLGNPDPFRLRYRESIAQLVSHIVSSKMNKCKAVLAIKQFAERDIVQQDRARFMEMVETELMGLHEGNIARYRLKPSEFEYWIKQWF